MVAIAPYALLDVGPTLSEANTGNIAATTAWGASDTGFGSYKTYDIPTSQVPENASTIILRAESSSNDDNGVTCNTKIYVQSSKFAGRRVSLSFSPNNSDDASGDSNTFLVPYTSTIDIKYYGKGPATHNAAKVYIDGYLTGGSSSGGDNGGVSGQIHAFRGPNITSEGSYTYNYPAEWTGGLPDEVFVTTVYPTSDAMSMSHIQLVSFNATSVTIFCQNYDTPSANVFANILLVKNSGGSSSSISSSNGLGAFIDIIQVQNVGGFSYQHQYSDFDENTQILVVVTDRDEGIGTSGFTRSTCIRPRFLWHQSVGGLWYRTY